MSNVDALNSEQSSQALRFLLHRMGLETRGAMMAELPAVYAKLYPSVNPSIILDKVRTRIGRSD
jgi:hypothetical protein